MCLAAYWNCLVGQVGLEPTTSSGNGFTVRGDTNYALLTHICAISGTSRNPVFYMLSALGLASMVLKVNKSLFNYFITPY